jgi:hypothetical protein
MVIFIKQSEEIQLESGTTIENRQTQYRGDNGVCPGMKMYKDSLQSTCSNYTGT